jgi:hypothetical protein
MRGWMGWVVSYGFLGFLGHFSEITENDVFFSDDGMMMT